MRHLQIQTTPFSTSITSQISLKSFKPRIPKFTLPNMKLNVEPAGNIIGTVNDAYVPPIPDEFHGSYHWTYERIVTISMVPLMLAPFVSGVQYPVVDAVLGVLLLWHCKAGFQSCIIDYIPKRVYGNWHNVALGLLSLGTWISLYGIYVIETEGNGLTDILIQLWSI
ncbi:hypothetical protein CANARDRAFT_29362 [[Candida] arabinofermentans NRRL YB-2248]|uniref:Succinate dehydrogenase [ubiquinone] cytochrome b small subunit n=1 Tax=[Candida] arabinofermentans NRRL YB-2248 TaxID=983967 RepID=A0A1E4SXI3_9ASCO|nr:hypothetical protein CANARDRAFT_29362 [[Candida] arabinofermentans NRRL YB-2248]